MVFNVFALSSSFLLCDVFKVKTNKFDFAVRTREQKKCWMALDQTFDGNQISFNSIHYRPISFNRLAEYTSVTC